jgi:hypothetical protein
LLFDFDFEQPHTDVPYHDGYNQQIPSNPTPIFHGAQVEGAVTEMLWDMYDAANDGNYLVFGQVWGHNNDYNSASWWRGMSEIWDVFMNYDPVPHPDSVAHKNCYTVYEFFDGWQVKGKPWLDSVLIKLSESRNVNFFLPGDVNTNNQVNTSDIIYLVNHVQKAGPPPIPPPSGDLNRSCDITNADIITLVNFVLKAGPRPLVGCNND